MSTLLLLLLVAQPAQDTLGYDFSMTTTQQITTSRLTPATVRNLITTRGHLTVILTDTVGGRTALIRLDTSTTTWENPGLEHAVVPIAPGTRFAVMLKAGLIQGAVRHGDSSLAAMQAIPLVTALFPRIRHGATIDERWTDTTTISSMIAGMPSTGMQAIHWHVLDRQGDLLTAEAVTAASSRTTLAADNTLRVTRNGTIRVSLRGLGPVETTRVVETANVDVTVGTVALRVRQQTTVDIGRDGPAPFESRRRVPS